MFNTDKRLLHIIKISFNNIRALLYNDKVLFYCDKAAFDFIETPFEIIKTPFDFRLVYIKNLFGIYQNLIWYISNFGLVYIK